MADEAVSARPSGWTHVAKWTAAIATPVVVAILITAFSPIGDGLRELVAPTSATVSGTVRLGSAGLGGAAIVIDGDRRVETQPDGSYVVDDVGRGNHALSVEALGARTHQASFSVGQGADSVTLGPVELTPSIRLAADIRFEFRPATLSTAYDVAVWIDEDEELAGQTAQVTYRLAAMPAPATVSAPIPRFCARFLTEIPLPDVVRGAVQATVGLTDGRSLEMQEPEIQAMTGGARPAECQAGPAAGDSAPLPTTVPTPTSSPPPPPPPSTDERAVVPDVSGVAGDTAAALLRSAGFVLATLDEASAAQPAGRVLRTEPRGGTRADRGSTVTLVVSSGPPATTVTIPDVVGLGFPAAEALLAATGLEVDVVQEASADVGAGLVIGTRPPAGTNVTPASTVVVVVSSGPPA